MTATNRRAVLAALVVAIAGQLADTGYRDVVSLVNDSPRTAQVDTITVDTVTNSATYTITLDGVALSYTADASAVNTEIVAGLVAAINTEPLVSGKVLASATSATVATVTARIAGQGFTLSDADAKLTCATTTADDDADPIGFGLGVVSDSRGRTAKSAAAASFTARACVITPTAVNSAVYTCNITINGRSFASSYTADGSATVQEIVEGMATAINAAMPASTVIATENDTTLILTAEVLGEDFTVVVGTNLSQAAFTGNTVNDLFAGVTLLDHTQTNESSGYAPNSTMSVLRRGRIYITTEDDISTSATVFLRTGGTGTVGAFRGSSDTGAIALDRSVARWVERISATQAVLEVEARA